MTKPVSIKPTAVATLQGVKIEHPLNVAKLQLVAKGFEAPKGFELDKLLACRTPTDTTKLAIATKRGDKVTIDRLVLPTSSNPKPHLFGRIHTTTGAVNAAWDLTGKSLDSSEYDLQTGGVTLTDYWVNIRRKADGSIFIGNTLHKDKKTAFKYANQGRTECIGTISVRLPEVADISMLSLEQPAPTTTEEVSATTTA